MNKLLLATLTSLGFLAAAQAQVTIRTWDGGGADNLWSNPLNWSDDNVPDSNSESGQFSGAANVTINVDQDFTINKYVDGFAGEGFTHLLYGAGTLTIDVNSAATTVGLDNATGNAGGTLRLNGKVRISNTGAGVTTMRNSNSAGNILLFDTGSTLTVNTSLQTVTSAGGTILMNGTLAGSLADLQINSANVFFGTGHNSSGFGRDVVFFANSKLAVDGGTVLAAGRKFQVNGTNAELELNGANAVNGANINVGGTNNFLVDVNANQANMGTLADIGGTLTIDLDPSITNLSFLDSSANSGNWTGGSLAITGFRNGVIRFGTDANGLTAGQLALIAGGGFYLDANGYLSNNAFPFPTAITVSLEKSTDLVNWEPATAGDYLIYPGNEVFFRARID